MTGILIGRGNLDTESCRRKTQREVSHLQAKERNLWRNHPCWHLDFWNHEIMTWAKIKVGCSTNLGATQVPWKYWAILINYNFFSNTHKLPEYSGDWKFSWISQRIFFFLSEVGVTEFPRSVNKGFLKW